MRLDTTERGFACIEHQTYLGGGTLRLALESSAIGDYPDSLSKPGSSYLWLGDHFHLDREDIAELVVHLERWLETGSLRLDTEPGRSRQ